jgi:hypothetical protein
MLQATLTATLTAPSVATSIDRIDSNGFAPRRHVRARGRRSAMLAQLITSVALVLSIAAAAVSIGIARADSPAATARDPGVPIRIS